MSKLGNLGARLHHGEVGYDFVKNRKIWYGISILITITAIVGLAVRGLHMGIEFQGGAVFTTPKNMSVSVAKAEEYAEEASGHDAIVQKLGDGSMRIQVAGIDTNTSDKIKDTLAEDLQVDAEQINAELVGPSWGEQIANKAWQGLGIFLILVVIYLAIAFEWRMALAAFVALIHDITITVGIYALVGFEVTPGTVIGLLTILGYSLYDTVVVFDSLKEQTRDITKQTRWTYSEIANRSINSTLVRSINTTVVALLPVAGLLFIGGGVLGAGMLNDISLSLFVGLAAGAYSSIFIATPLVADLKEREPAMKSLKKRVLAEAGPDGHHGRVRGRRGLRRGVRRRARGRGARGRRTARPADLPRPRPSLREAPMTELTDLSTLLLSRIRDVADHPEPGVMFKDITPLLADPAAFSALSDALADIARDTGATKVVGLEARGFILGAPAAVRAGVGFIPVRKAGKLPGAILSQAYDLEYGSAEIEVHAEDLSAGDRVLVVDDVLATGGTAEASLQLIRRAGAEVAGLAVLMELGFLGGRARLEPALAGAPLKALLTI
ncbi:adenine phosphoribosyltransferase [Streptomyces calvus]